MTWLFDGKILFWRETPEWIKRIFRILKALWIILIPVSELSAFWYLSGLIVVGFISVFLFENDLVFWSIFSFIDYVILTLIGLYIFFTICDNNPEIIKNNDPE